MSKIPWGSSPPATLLNCLVSPGQAIGGQLRAEALFKPQGGLGAQAEGLGGLPVVVVVKVGRLQKHAVGGWANFAASPSNNPTNAHRVVSISDDQHFGI